MKISKRPLILSIILISAFYSCKKSSPKPASPALPPANLIAYWSLNNNAKDGSRYGNNGIAYNVTPVTDRFGKVNNAFYFDGHSSYVAVPDSEKLRLANTDFTINAWVKLDSYSGQNASAILSKRISGANHGWLWAINGAGNTPLGAVYFGPGGGTPVAIGTKVISTGQWYMLTCVYNLSQKSLSIYVNGTLDNTVSNILPSNASIASTLFIGKDELGQGEDEYFFKGSLDEIRIYNIALDQASINTLYIATN